MRRLVVKKVLSLKQYSTKVRNFFNTVFEFFYSLEFSDIRKLNIGKSVQEKEVKCDILHAKWFNLDEEIAKEEDLEKKIVSVTPPKFDASLKIEDMSKAMNKCLSALKIFYENLEASTETQSSSKLWNSIKDALTFTPNIFIFQAILKQVSANSDVAKQLDAAQLTSNDLKSSIDQQLLSGLNKRLIISGIELLSLKSKLRGIKALCSESILNVTSNLESMNNSYNYSFQYEDEDIVGDFIGAILNRLVLQGKIKFGNSVIVDLKQRVFDQEIMIKNYALTTQDLKNVYTSIDDKVLCVQQGIAQMYHINEKLNFGKISMMHFVQDLKNSSKFQEMNRTMMNISMSLTSVKEIALPMHRNELQMFLELPVENLDSAPNAVACELKKNHLVTIGDDESIAALARQTNCDLRSLNRFLKSLKLNLKRSEKLLPILSTLNPKVESPSDLSISELEKRHDANRESIAELLDEITNTNCLTMKFLKEMGVLYQYLLTNPLKRFIPVSRKFDGKSFKEYENIFSLYYKMVKN